MMYKVFAGGTLIAAPMIVLALQNFVPATPHPTPAADVAPAAIPQPVAPPVITPTAPPAFVAPQLDEPVSDAGQPSVDPGAGLPVSSGQASLDAPPGSPNAEH